MCKGLTNSEAETASFTVLQNIREVHHCPQSSIVLCIFQTIVSKKIKVNHRSHCSCWFITITIHMLLPTSILLTNNICPKAVLSLQENLVNEWIKPE